MARPNSTGPATALVSSTTHPARVIPCSCATRASRLTHGKSSQRPPGLHSHFLVWSPDQAFIYFVQGSVPDRMDIWRIRPTGGTPERITSHDSLVSHPVFLNARTRCSTSPATRMVRGLDPQLRCRHDAFSRRVSFGIDRYTRSPRAPTAAGWWRRSRVRRARFGDCPSPTQVAETSSGASHLADDRQRIVSAAGRRLSALRFVQRCQRQYLEAARRHERPSCGARPRRESSEVPRSRGTDRRIAFSVRQNGHTLLYVVNDDGTNARVTHELAGAAGRSRLDAGRSVRLPWRSIIDGVPRLFTVPLDGRSPTPLVQEYSVDPVWSPDGEYHRVLGRRHRDDVPGQGGEGRRQRLPNAQAHADPRRRHLCFMPGRSPSWCCGEISDIRICGRSIWKPAPSSVDRFRSGLRRARLRRLLDGHDIVLAASARALRHRPARASAGDEVAVIATVNRPCRAPAGAAIN